ncbi:hypothetical protein RRG08_062595 [Elysia crispata]|uniref:Uncharacterized protein n=1 Tax=Elysia crispata TaxID=231223 RepID=A0AAE1D7P7_9GAST|nr:hypothetical protein RRG08_062595 [Elysia crispata]
MVGSARTKPEDPTVTQPVTSTNWWGRPGLNLRILQQHNLLQAPTGGTKPEEPAATQPVTGTKWWGRPRLNLRNLQQHNLLQAPNGTCSNTTCNRHQLVGSAWTKPEEPAPTQPVTGTNWWDRPGLNLRNLQQHNLLQAPNGGRAELNLRNLQQHNLLQAPTGGVSVDKT